MVDPSEYCIMPASRVSDMVSRTSLTVTPWAAMRFGSTRTCGILIRSPHIATLATPRTASRCSLIFQYVVIDRSMTECSFEEIPIFIVLAVDDRGGNINGGAAQGGRGGRAIRRGPAALCPPAM